MTVQRRIYNTGHDILELCAIFPYRLDSSQVRRNLVYELHQELPNNVRLRILGNQKILKNPRFCSRHGLVFSLPSRNEILTIAVKKHAELNFELLKSFPILLDFFTFFSNISSEVNSVGIYLLKINNRNTRTMCDKCSKLIIKTPEPRQWPLSGVFIVNFKHILLLILVFLLLTLNIFHFLFQCFYC